MFLSLLYTRVLWAGLIILLILTVFVPISIGAQNVPDGSPLLLFPDTGTNLSNLNKTADPFLSKGENDTLQEDLITILSTVWIQQGEEIFIGEKGLEISLAMGPARQIAWWDTGMDPYTTDPDTIIRITNSQIFFVDPEDFTNKTGTWYRWEGENLGVAFYIRDPIMDVRIFDATTGEDVTDGTMIAGNLVNFRIDTNLYPIGDRVNYNAHYDGPFWIEIRNENGVLYDSLYGLDGILYPLYNLTVTSQPWYWIGTKESHYSSPSDNGWNTALRNGIVTYPSGRYSVRAGCDSNDMQIHYRAPDGSVYVGKTVSRIRIVTLRTDEIEITAVPSYTIPGEKILVRLTGTPDTPYYVWFKKTRSMTGQTGDQPPVIPWSQTGVEQDPVSGPYFIGSYRYEGGNGLAIRDDVPFRPDNGVSYYARVMTDSTGERTFQITTSRATALRQYELHAERMTGIGYASDDADIIIGKGAVTLFADGDMSYYIGEKVLFSGLNAASPDTYLFICGGNLPVKGGRLTDPYIPVENGVAESFTRVTVSRDQSWEYIWNTAFTSLPPGQYTIYAVSGPYDRMSLAESSYASLSIWIKGGHVTAVSDKSHITLGEDLLLTGTNSESLYTCLYLMGPDLPKNGVMLSDPTVPSLTSDVNSFTTVNVDLDDSWEYNWETGGISLSPGTYTITAVSGPYADDARGQAAYAQVPVEVEMRPGVRLSSDVSELYPGSSFIVTVHAEPFEEFYLWVRGTGFMSGGSGDQPPVMQDAQTGVYHDPENGPYLIGTYSYDGGQGETIRDDIPKAPYDGVMYYAKVATDTRGLCPVRFLTSPDTRIQSYEIHAENSAGSELRSDTISVLIQNSDVPLTVTTDTPFVDPGEPFTVLITGEQNQEYYLWVKDTRVLTGESGDQPPLIAADPQKNVWFDGEYGPYSIGSYLYLGGNGRGIRDNVPLVPYNGVRYYCKLLTGDDGCGRVRLLTSDDTREMTYTLHAERKSGFEYASADTSVTVGSPQSPVTLTIPTDEVTLDSSCQAILMGEPETSYYLWFSDTAGMSGADGDKPPSFASNLAGISFDAPPPAIQTIGSYHWFGGEGKTIYESVCHDPVMQGTRYYGLVTTNNAGYQTVTIDTTSDTKTGIYSLHAERCSLDCNEECPDAVYANALLTVILDSHEILSLSLAPGWNLIATPKPLAAGHDTASIFNGVPTGGHSLWRYDPMNAYGYVPVMSSDIIEPLEGYWIYSDALVVVPLIFETNPPTVPLTKGLTTGWNIIGYTATNPLSARIAFVSVQDAWATCVGFNGAEQRYETAILNGGTGEFSDTRHLYPGSGYWLFMEKPGTLQTVL